MAASTDRAADPRRREVPWFWLALVAVIVLALGYVGFWQYRAPDPVTARGLADLLYYDVQLFALEFNGIDGVSAPWLLQVARFLAPATAILGGTLAFLGRSWWFRRGFTVVVGDSVDADAVAQVARARTGRAVFQIDGGTLAQLQAAGLRRARAVYLIGDAQFGPVSKVATALAAAINSNASIYVHVSDPGLAVDMRALHLMRGSPDMQGGRDSQKIDFFNLDELAARAYLEWDRPDATSRPHIVVAGASAFGRAVIVAFARAWHDAAERAGERIRVTLVDEHASAAAQAMRDRWSVVADHCDVTTHDVADFETALRSGVLGPASAPDSERPYRTYLCYEDEDVALRSALAAAATWAGGPGSLVVRLSRLAQDAAPFTDGGHLAIANVGELAAAAVIAGDEPFADIYWRLAPQIHGRYVAERLAQGHPLRDPALPALVPWEELPPDLRLSNYDQARDLAVKLRSIGATVAPRSAGNPALTLDAAEVEKLSRDEHERWMRDRRARGWRFGEVRDDKAKRHPKLVSWDELPDGDRDKDRAAVRSLTTEYAQVLAEFGLQIVRF